MKFARIDDGKAVEFFETDGDITTMFHPDMVWVLATEDAKIGSPYSDGVFSAPPGPPPVTAMQARAQRDALLDSTDWTQLPDVSEAVAAQWISYRQALRDVPTQSGFPTSIDWPEVPSAGGSRVGMSRVGTATVGSSATGGNTSNAV